MYNHLVVLIALTLTLSMSPALAGVCDSKSEIECLLSEAEKVVKDVEENEASTRVSETNLNDIRKSMAIAYARIGNISYAEALLGKPNIDTIRAYIYHLYDNNKLDEITSYLGQINWTEFEKKRRSLCEDVSILYLKKNEVEKTKNLTRLALCDKLSVQRQLYIHALDNNDFHTAAAMTDGWRKDPYYFEPMMKSGISVFARRREDHTLTESEKKEWKKILTEYLHIQEEYEKNIEGKKGQLQTDIPYNSIYALLFNLSSLEEIRQIILPSSIAVGETHSPTPEQWGKARGYFMGSLITQLDKKWPDASDKDLAKFIGDIDLFQINNNMKKHGIINLSLFTYTLYLKGFPLSSNAAYTSNSSELIDNQIKQVAVGSSLRHFKGGALNVIKTVHSSHVEGKELPYFVKDMKGYPSECMKKNLDYKLTCMEKAYKSVLYGYAKKRAGAPRGFLDFISMQIKSGHYENAYNEIRKAPKEWVDESFKRGVGKYADNILKSEYLNDTSCNRFVNKHKSKVEKTGAPIVFNNNYMDLDIAHYFKVFLYTNCISRKNDDEITLSLQKNDRKLSGDYLSRLIWVLRRSERQDLANVIIGRYSERLKELKYPPKKSGTLSADKKELYELYSKIEEAQNNNEYETMISLILEHKSASRSMNALNFHIKRYITEKHPEAIEKY